MKELEALKDMDFDFMYWVAGFFALLELFKWIYTTKDFWLKALGFKTKGMLKREEYETRLKNVEDSIAEIKNTSKNNVNMFLDHEKQVVDKIIDELNKLHDKLDRQQAEMMESDEKKRKTERVILRNAIADAMRQVGQNVGPDGKIHIRLSDYENLDELFEEYFDHLGNGAFKRMYEDEFSHVIIDR